MEAVSKFLEVLTESVNLLVSLQGADGQIAKTARILSDALASGRRIFLAGERKDQPLARLVKSHWEESLLGTSVPNVSPFCLISTSDEILARDELAAEASQGDVLVLLAASRPSPRLTELTVASRELGMVTCCVTGADQWLLGGMSDVVVQVPTGDSHRASEMILFVCHCLADEAKDEEKTGKHDR